MGFSVAGQRVVVLGAGRSGRAAAHLLVARGAYVTLADAGLVAIEGAEALRAAGVNTELGPHRPEMLRSADLVVLSPGVEPSRPEIVEAQRAGVPVIGEVELASRWLAGRVVAVTGTKGKSTTTVLAARMLREGGFTVTAGGNLGTALSEQVAESRPEAIHVVEVSSFQLETTETFRPWIAVLVNVSPDHLDRHPSFEEYARAKARIFSSQTSDQWAVVNADDPAARTLAASARARRFDFALTVTIRDGVTVEGDAIVQRRAGHSTPLLPLASVRVPGRHLLADVLAASAVGALAGVPPAAIDRAVQGFNGLAHTLERVAEVDGVRFVNDSKATNVASALRAIESFEGGVVAIMGGRHKGGDFADLAGIVRARAAAVVAIGEASALIDRALAGVAPVSRAGSMADAVRRAFALAPPGGVVLLAPACSSFDMFQDYAARGRAFAEEVQRIADERRAVNSHQIGNGGREPSAGNIDRHGL